MLTRAALFSAALCRGLIEAPNRRSSCPSRTGRFPRLYAAASLKPRRVLGAGERTGEVFRGFMPRPH